ncbi:hypothetical protein H1R85_05985, partial [Flavobacterium psychrophilum]
EIFNVILNIKCTKNNDVKQNLYINVTRKATNQNDIGIAGVNIYLERGKSGSFISPNYSV